MFHRYELCWNISTPYALETKVLSWFKNLFFFLSHSAFIMGIKLAEINGWQTLLSSPHHTTAVAVVLLGASSSSLLTAPISCSWLNHPHMKWWHLMVLCTTCSALTWNCFLMHVVEMSNISTWKHYTFIPFQTDTYFCIKKLKSTKLYFWEENNFKPLSCLSVASFYLQGQWAHTGSGGVSVAAMPLRCTHP